MNYNCLLDLLPPLAVIWVGTAVGVICCHTVVVVTFGILGAADVMKPCAVGNFGVVGHNTLESVGFGTHHVYCHSWVGHVWHGFDIPAWGSGMLHWCGHHQCRDHTSNNS